MTGESNILIPQVDGPDLVTGELAVVAPAGVRAMQSAMLCRCGQSRDKPFCDGAHAKSGFSDPARLPADVECPPIEAGSLTIRPMPNGPNRCEGPLAIRGSDGRRASASLTLLCRCGGSRRKPYCDGTHEKIGFRG